MLFILFMSGLVGIIEKSGGLLGITEALRGFVKTPRSAQLASFAAGCVSESFCTCLVLLILLKSSHTFGWHVCLQSSLMTIRIALLLATVCALCLTWLVSVGKSLVRVVCEHLCTNLNPIFTFLFCISAFIVDATAAPIASITPVSAWVGFEIDLIQQELNRCAHQNISSKSSESAASHQTFISITMKDLLSVRRAHGL